MTTPETNKPTVTEVVEDGAAKALHLSTPDLIKAINEEYSVILGSERANLPRALIIAEKLNALRARTPKGQWKPNFKKFGLNISYETASVYLRIWEHWPEIQDLAAERGVETTLLTIDGARELWARRKDKPTTETEDETEADDIGDGKPTAEAMVAKQTANAEEEAAALDDDDDDVEGWFVHVVKVFSQDELLDLTQRLAEHLRMRLIPLDTLEALGREVDGAAATNQQPTSSLGTVFERRI